MGGLLSATGGVNGVSVGNPAVGGGGAAGVGSGGTQVNSNGGVGGGGYYTYFGGGGAGAGGPLGNGTNGGNVMAWTGSNCLQPGGTGGNGGGAPGGNGGKGSGFTDASCNNNNPSLPGGNFGAGGGGGNGNSGPGSAGAGGYCQISWVSCATPAAPLNITPAANQTICANNSTTLTVTSTLTTNWYSSPSSTVVLVNGLSYTTPTLTAGSYTYYAASTNTCGEGPRTAVNINVNAIPSVSVSSSASLICNGQSATLTANGANTYLWNTTSTNTAITVSPTVTTSYTVTGTTNNCANTTIVTQNVSACTGITSVSANPQALTIYPNPNKGDFTISTNSEMNLSIINNLGQLVKNISITAANNYKASVTDLPNGIYFITSSDNKSIKQKIIVAK
ncbi:MAG: T9SS type A sorting domain-containing protein [Bacteroidetes bacterium]|nr:T9SS type A sorting domain-containing protein [Bacteroidota bacterium]